MPTVPRRKPQPPHLRAGSRSYPVLRTTMNRELKTLMNMAGDGTRQSSALRHRWPGVGREGAALPCLAGRFY